MRGRDKDYKVVWGNFWRFWICSLSWLWWWLPVCILTSKFIKLYILNVNYTLTKLFLQKYFFANSHPHDTSLVGFYSELDTEDISTPPQSIWLLTHRILMCIRRLLNHSPAKDSMSVCYSSRNIVCHNALKGHMQKC